VIGRGDRDTHKMQLPPRNRLLASCTRWQWSRPGLRARVTLTLGRIRSDRARLWRPTARRTASGSSLISGSTFFLAYRVASNPLRPAYGRTWCDLCSIRPGEGIPIPYVVAIRQTGHLHYTHGTWLDENDDDYDSYE
jgi:hypothetical protein